MIHGNLWWFMVIYGDFGDGLWHWFMALGLPTGLPQGNSNSPRSSRGLYGGTVRLLGCPDLDVDRKCIVWWNRSQKKKQSCSCLKEIHRICKVSIYILYIYIFVCFGGYQENEKNQIVLGPRFCGWTWTLKGTYLIWKGTVYCDKFLYVKVQSALDQVWDCKSKVASGND